MSSTVQRTIRKNSPTMRAVHMPSQDQCAAPLGLLICTFPSFLQNPSLFTCSLFPKYQMTQNDRGTSQLQLVLMHSELSVLLPTPETEMYANHKKTAHTRAQGDSVPSTPLSHIIHSSSREITAACFRIAPPPSFLRETQTVSSVFRKSRNFRSRKTCK